MRLCICGRSINGREYDGHTLCRACRKKANKPESRAGRALRLTGGVHPFQILRTEPE